MEYKGFEIEQSRMNDRFYVGERIRGAGFLDADFCPKQGYATESAAKVAITKYLKQQEQVEKSHDRIMNGDIECDSYEGSCYMDDEEYSNPLIKEFEKMLDKFGKEDNPVQQSRNKREGRFHGCTNGFATRYHGKHKLVFSVCYIPANRKQRKAAKLARWKQVDKFCDKLFG